MGFGVLGADLHGVRLVLETWDRQSSRSTLDATDHSLDRELQVNYTHGIMIIHGFGIPRALGRWCLTTLLLLPVLPVDGQTPAKQGPAANAATFNTSAGHFVGQVKTLWNDDGRNMTLLEDFSYVDPDGLEWKALKGLMTDGASIPQEAWSIIGGPFEGPYRLAAVVHDAACDAKIRSWESVHEMFYRAMLTAHVDETKAKVMYAAVYHFGPRWTLVSTAKGINRADSAAVVNTIQNTVHSTSSHAEVGYSDAVNQAPGKQDLTVRFIPPPVHFTQVDFDALKAFIQEREASSPGSVSLEQIRNFHSPEPAK